MAEAKVIALKEALYKQAQSIQELSDELEEERKAAASGADEALSMIFRLQKERAMEKMEACQYKRMAEAKMIHSQESLAFLKESILEKEIEIATLRFQVEAYRQNMLRNGKNNTFLNVPGSDDRFRRHISMPTSWFDNLNLDMDIIDKIGPLIPTIPSIRTNFFPNKSIVEEAASYSESPETKEDLSLKLIDEERVISLPVSADDESKSNTRTDAGGDSRNCEDLFKVKLRSMQIKSKCSYCSCLYLEKDSTGEAIHSMNIGNNYGCESGSCGAAMEAKQRAVEGKEFTMTRSNIGRGVSMDPLQSDVEELKRRVQKLEDEQWIMKEEESKRNNEHLNLAKQINEQLNIQSQTKVTKNKQVSKHDEILMLSVREAILSLL